MVRRSMSRFFKKTHIKFNPEITPGVCPHCDSTTSFVVSDNSGINVNDFIQFNSEVMKVSNVGSSGLITVERSQFSTAASSHDNGDIKSLCELSQYVSIGDEVIKPTP